MLAAAGGFPEEGGLLWQSLCVDLGQQDASIPMVGRRRLRGGGWGAESVALKVKTVAADTMYQGC